MKVSLTESRLVVYSDTLPNPFFKNSTNEMWTIPLTW